MPVPQGIVLYEGPSLLTGDPVVAVATGIVTPSTNKKTGPVVQCYVLPAGEDPVGAARSGADASVCGSCPHRPRGSHAAAQGTCYVVLFHGPRAVYAAWRSGTYPAYDPRDHDRWLRGRAFRFGAYGDPAAVPTAVWDGLAGLARTFTGYTHAWASADPGLARTCMASCDSPADREAARALGYRTFRVREPGPGPHAERDLPGEVTCPASAEFEAERGHRLTCLECGLCAGSARAGARDVAIDAHGATAGRFAETHRPIETLEVLAGCDP